MNTCPLPENFTMTLDAEGNLIKMPKVRGRGSKMPKVRDRGSKMPKVRAS